MPILNFTIRSQELDNPADHTTQIAQKTIKLNDTYKMKYFKLLHLYHNINFSNIHNEDDTSQMSNTIIFAKISFLNSQQSVFMETKDGELIQHNGMICLGETIKTPYENTFRDVYKVLHSKGILYINQPFTVQLFQLGAKDPDADNTAVADYNATGSHLIEPITCDQFRGPLNEGGQYLSLVFEYEEDEGK